MSGDFVSEFSVKTSFYLLAAASTMVALSWNETLKGLVHTKMASKLNPSVMNIAYSLTITGILILLIWILPDSSDEMPKNEQMKIQSARTNEPLNDIPPLQLIKLGIQRLF